MPIGVVFLKLITHWLCIIVHEGLHRRAANSRPLGLSLDACFVVTDSAGQKLAYLSRMITVNYFMQFLGAKSAGEIDQCRLVNQRLKSSNSSGGLFPRKLVGELRVYRVMQRGWNSQLVFPIKDAASAALMLIKADCLHTAGIINEAEKQYVYSRARTFLDDATSKDVVFLNRQYLAEEQPCA